jgi:hypothetical protein
MPDNLHTDLDQFLVQRGQSPMADLSGESQIPQKVSKIVGQCKQLQTHLIVPEIVA